MPHLETVGKQKTEIRGGNFEYYLQDKFLKHTEMQVGLISKNNPELSLAYSKSP